MGLLDDAIRDHLDLKRRRGADPAEIERAEREALGPVHREPIASEEGAESAYESESAAYGHPQEHEAAAPVGEGLHEGLDEDEEWDEDYDDEDYGDDEEVGSHRAEDLGPTHHSASARETAHEPDDRSGPVQEDLHPTRAYDVHEAGAESEAASEDPLEETPDFLQDTPDHDRLWFEQRPPKDFDFDE